MLNILNMDLPNIQITNMSNALKFISKGGDAEAIKNYTLKGGEAYKVTPYRQKRCSDVPSLGFQVGGAR